LKLLYKTHENSLNYYLKTLLLLREKIASINRKFFWQAREKIFVGLPEKTPSFSGIWHIISTRNYSAVNFYYIPLSHIMLI